MNKQPSLSANIVYENNVLGEYTLYKMCVFNLIMVSLHKY